MTFDEIDLLVRRANPVPDPGALEPTGADETDDHVPGRTTVQIQDLTEVTEQQPRREERPRRPLIGVAAAALVIVVALVAVAALTGGDDGEADEAAAPTTAPLDVAEAFVGRLAAFDPDGAASYLTAGALDDAGGFDALRGELRWQEAAGFQAMFEECEVIAAGTVRTVLRCPYAYHGLRSDELGFPPFEGSDYRVVVRDGRVEDFDQQVEFTTNGFDRQVWEPFGAWLSARHPGDVGVMYADASMELPAHDRSLELWEQRTREYVESEQG